MKKFSKQFQKGKMFILIFFLCGVIYATGSWYTGYKVDHGTKQTVNGGNNGSICKKVTNNSSNGLAVFVPTKTDAEMNAFVTKHPSDITVGACDACDVPGEGISYDLGTNFTSWHCMGGVANRLYAANFMPAASGAGFYDGYTNNWFMFYGDHSEAEYCKTAGCVGKSSVCEGYTQKNSCVNNFDCFWTEDPDYRYSWYGDRGQRTCYFKPENYYDTGLVIKGVQFLTGLVYNVCSTNINGSLKILDNYSLNSGYIRNRHTSNSYRPYFYGKNYQDIPWYDYYYDTYNNYYYGNDYYRFDPGRDNYQNLIHSRGVKNLGSDTKYPNNFRVRGPCVLPGTGCTSQKCKDADNLYQNGSNSIQYLTTYTTYYGGQYAFPGKDMYVGETSVRITPTYSNTRHLYYEYGYIGNGSYTKVTTSCSSSAHTCTDLGIFAYDSSYNYYKYRISDKTIKQFYYVGEYYSYDGYPRPSYSIAISGFCGFLNEPIDPNCGGDRFAGTICKRFKNKSNNYEWACIKGGYVSSKLFEYGYLNGISPGAFYY